MEELDLPIDHSDHSDGMGRRSIIRGIGVDDREDERAEQGNNGRIASRVKLDVSSSGREEGVEVLREHLRDHHRVD